MEPLETEGDGISSGTVQPGGLPDLTPPILPSHEHGDGMGLSHLMKRATQLADDFAVVQDRSENDVAGRVEPRGGQRR